MEVILLIVCVIAAWALGTTLDHLPALGQLFIPSRWLLLIVGTIFVTWLMHE